MSKPAKNLGYQSFVLCWHFMPFYCAARAAKTILWVLDYASNTHSNTGSKVVMQQAN
jgi:hypothetical protein